MTTGILHPGAMGATVAACCADDCVWASAGRSEVTVERALAAGLRDVETVEAMITTCDTIISVCPPGAAVSVAQHVAELRFEGCFVDANAIAPDTARAIGSAFARFVDASLVGSPPAEPGSIRMYLAGEEAAAVATLWAESNIEVRVIDGPPGAASALKMAYAGWTKGSAALLLAIRAYAAAEGVEAALVAEWDTSIPHLPDRSIATATATAPKAWRFVGEMHEIASALESAGVPGDFHQGAARVYESMAVFKTVSPIDLATVLHTIIEAES